MDVLHCITPNTHDNSSPLTMLRRSDVQRELGISASTIYRLIHDGLFPKPVTIGPRSVAWPRHEIEQVTRARIAGLSVNEIVSLIAKIHQDRITSYQWYLKNLQKLVDIVPIPPPEMVFLPDDDMAIEKAKFLPRTYNCLKAAGMNTLGDVSSKCAHELLNIKNFGLKSLQNVANVLTAHGFSLPTNHGCPKDRASIFSYEQIKKASTPNILTYEEFERRQRV